MASQHLPNYLRTYRKNAALSQEEVAYLLGAQSGAKVCRYERFTREPGLKTALAYEAIFQKPISKPFPALYEKIQSQVKARAKRLEGRNSGGNANRLGTLKRQTLTGIASTEAESHLKQS